MQLLERNTAGLQVVVDFVPETQSVFLVCQCDDRLAMNEIPPDRVLDAFEHPTCYLRPGELNSLFTSVEVED